MSDTSNIQTQAPATPKKTVSEWLNHSDFKAQLAAALPKHITPDRMVRVVLTASMKNPKLFQCTQESLFSSVLACSAIGLEPDGRRAHLIPYGNVCTLILDYKGIVELVRRSGDVKAIHADTICDNDAFEYDRGQIIKHTIDFKKERGAVYAVYAEVTLKDDVKQSCVMTRSDVELIRKRSKASASGPWVTDWNEMAKKTAFKRLSKWLTLSPEIRDAIAVDDEPIDIETITKAQTVSSLADVFDPKALPTATSETASPAPEPTAEDKAQAKAAQDKLREIIIKDLQGAILDGKTTEAKLTKLAKEQGLMTPENADIWELPTEALAKLTESIK